MSDVIEVDTLYKVASAAKLLDVSRDWVYTRIKSGELAVVELGYGRKNQRIRASEIQRLIDERSFGTPPSEALLSGEKAS